MLVIDNRDEFCARIDEVRNSTNTITGTVARYAEIFDAVIANEAYAESGEHYLFAYFTDEYKQARWLFQATLQLAYPEVPMQKVYTMWLENRQRYSLPEITRIVREGLDKQYWPWS